MSAPLPSKARSSRTLLEERNFPAAEIKLLDDDESLGQLERVQDEVALVQPVGRDELAPDRLYVLRLRREFTRKKWKLAREAGSAICRHVIRAGERAWRPGKRAVWWSVNWASSRSLRLESSSIVTAHPAARGAGASAAPRKKSWSHPQHHCHIFEPGI